LLILRHDIFIASHMQSGFGVDFVFFPDQRFRGVQNVDLFLFCL